MAGMAGAMMGSADAKTARQSQSSLKLLMQAAGTPQEMLEKILRLFAGFRTYANQREFRRRLKLLKARGLIDKIPTRAQLFFGGFDMLRFFIAPGAMDYIESRGLNFTFHQILRILDEPFSMVDPVGLLSTRDNIIGHVMQVVHADASYDLALLGMFEDGLEQMESQVQAMLDGSHPRARSIMAIVEDPEYHSHLLEYVQAYRRGDSSAALVRDNVDDLAERKPEYKIATAQFAEMPSAFRYFNRLPQSWPRGLSHFLAHKSLDRGLLDKDIAEKFEPAAS